MNNFMKKIISGILISSMALIPCTAFAYIEGIDMVPYDESEEEANKSTVSSEKLDAAYDILSYIGVITEEKDNIDPAAIATRALAASYFGRVKSTTEPSNVQLPYNDVSEITEYYSGICNAYQYGILEEDGKFNPTAQISVEAAAQMAMRTVEYDKMYPISQAMQFAMGNKLFSGIDISKNYLTVGDLIKFIENTLTVPYIETSIYGDSKGIKIDENVSYLEKYKDISVQTGIVTAVKYSSVYGDSELSDNQIEINRGVFDCNFKPDMNSVGESVRAYVDLDNENLVITLWKHRGVFGEYTGTLIEEVNESNIEIYDDKTIRLKFSADTRILYNDVYYGKHEKAYNEKKYDNCDNIKLIDNDSDGVYDVVKIYKSDSYIVNSISTVSDRIDFMYNKGSINLSEDNIEVYIEKGDKEISYKELLKWDVMSVYYAEKADGGKIYSCIAFDEKLTDILGSEYTKDNGIRCYRIDGEEFLLTDNYIDFLENNTSDTKPKIGDEFTFLLTYDGKIAGVVSQASGFSYGWLMRAYLDDEDENICGIQLYTMDGSVEKYYFKEKIKLYNKDNLKGKKLEARKAYEELKSADGIIYDMVGYKLNSKNEISEFVLPWDRTKAEAGITYNPGTTDYPLTKDYTNHTGTGSDGKPTYKNVRCYTNILDSKYYVGGKTMIIYPVDINDRANERLYQKSVLSYTDESFPTRNITLYNTDKYYEAGFISLGMNVSKTIDSETSAYMIADIQETIDENDMPVKQISYYSGSSVVAKNLSSDCVISEDTYQWFGKPQTLEELKTGDIIQLSTNTAGDINCVRVIYKVDKPSPMGYQDPRSATSDGITMYSVSAIKVIHGKVTDYSDKVLMVDIADEGEDSNIWPMPSGWGIYGRVTYTMFDSKKGDIQVIDRNEIKTGDEIVIKKRYNYAVDFFIIR